MLLGIAGHLSRDKLLDAAAQLALSDGPDAGLERVTFAAVAGLSGVSPSTLYTIWPTVGDFHGDLFADLADARGLCIGATPMVDLLTDGVPPFEMIGRWMERDVEALARSPQFELLVTAAMVAQPSRHVPEGSTQRVAATLRARVGEAEAAAAARLAVLLPYFGRRLKHGVEPTDLTLPLSALKIGAALALPVLGGTWDRSWVDHRGRAAARPLISIATEALAAAMTETADDHPNAAVWSLPATWPDASHGSHGRSRHDIDWSQVTRDDVEADGGDPPSRWSKDLAGAAALKSGLSLAAAGGLRPGLGWIKLSRLLSDLGLSSGAAHATWADHEAFQARLAYVLLTEMIDDAEKADTDEVAAMISSADLDYPEMARRSVGIWRGLLDRGYRFRVQIGLWRWARYRPEADPGLRQVYVATHRQVETVLSAVFETHRRVPRHGLTVSDLAWITVMIIEGSDVLRWFQPERLEPAERVESLRPDGSAASWAAVALWLHWLGEILTEAAD